jgi:hypothetical protein
LKARRWSCWSASITACRFDRPPTGESRRTGFSGKFTPLQSGTRRGVLLFHSLFPRYGKIIIIDIGHDGSTGQTDCAAQCPLSACVASRKRNSRPSTRGDPLNRNQAGRWRISTADSGRCTSKRGTRWWRF